MATGPDGGGRRTFGPSAWSQWLTRVVVTGTGLVVTVIAVVPFSWVVEDNLASRAFMALVGGFMVWLGVALFRSRPAFELRPDGVEYLDGEGRRAFIARDLIGLVTVHTADDAADMVLLDRTGQRFFESPCPRRQWPDLERACRDLGYPWSPRLPRHHASAVVPAPKELPFPAGPTPGVVRVEQGFQGGVGKQVYPVLAAAAAVLALFVLAVGARVGLMLVLPLVPMALLFVWIGPRLAPTGPVAIEVGRDRVVLVEADGTSDAVPRERIGAITVEGMPNRLVITDRAGREIVSRTANHYRWMALRQALLAAGYPWRDPVLVEGDQHRR